MKRATPRVKRRGTLESSFTREPSGPKRTFVIAWKKGTIQNDEGGGVKKGKTNCTRLMSGVVGVGGVKIFRNQPKMHAYQNFPGQPGETTPILCQKRGETDKWSQQTGMELAQVKGKTQGVHRPISKDGQSWCNRRQL